MPQIFHRSSNTFSRVSIIGGVLFLGVLTLAALVFVRSPFVTAQGTIVEQPVPFSHKHHAGDDGIDCRYCHTNVETSDFAGLPATQICMNCHSQIWTTAPVLQPVRDSFANNTPIVWNRVYVLPDFVYFDHSIHVNKGIGCATCHGPVDQMPLMYKATSLQMTWCIDCHRNPIPYLRPLDQVFNMAYQPPTNQEQLGRQLAHQYHVKTYQDCTTCHR
ncbi:MAG: cytochrome c family protein [Chloroflexi bacterium]|nr:cytochrome c family protein [Chloroflexota bacterium]